MGRVTSLPKIWKGSRKRKKQKAGGPPQTVPTNQPNSLQTIQEENVGVNSEQTVEDVFQMFDDVFKTPTIINEAEKPVTNEPVGSEIAKVDTQIDSNKTQAEVVDPDDGLIFDNDEEVNKYLHI